MKRSSTNKRKFDQANLTDSDFLSDFRKQKLNTEALRPKQEPGRKNFCKISLY